MIAQDSWQVWRPQERYTVDSSEIAERVLELLAGLRNPPFDSLGLTPLWNDIHKNKLLEAVKKGIRIDFVLPAFPAKSPNPEKNSWRFSRLRRGAGVGSTE